MPLSIHEAMVGYIFTDRFIPDHPMNDGTVE